MAPSPEEVVRATFVDSDEGRSWKAYMAPDFRMHGAILGAIAPQGGLEPEAAAEMMSSVRHRTRLLQLENAPDGRVFTEFALSRDSSAGHGSAQIVYALWSVHEGLVTELHYAEDPGTLRREAGLDPVAPAG